MKLRFLFLVCTIVFYAGCARLDRTQAAQLAAKGQQVSGSGNEALETLNADINGYLESQEILVPLTGRPALTDQARDDIASYQESLRARIQMYKELQQYYVQFAALGAYDARGEVTGAVTDLQAAVDTYGRTVNPDYDTKYGPISGAVGAIAGTTLGWIAGYYQEELLCDASEQIRPTLYRIGQLHEEENDSYAAVSSAAVESRLAVAKTLKDLGFSIPHGMLRSYSEQFGMEAIAVDQYPAQLAKLSANDRVSFNAAVDKRLEYHADEIKRLNAKTFSTVMRSIQNLHTQHVNLEKGRDISFETIAADLQQLQLVTRQLTALLTTINPPEQQQ